MSRLSRVLTRPLLLAGVGLGAVALAATSPLLFSATNTDGYVSLTTSELPKGWFSTGSPSNPTFDATRTTLVTTYGLGATACSQALTFDALSSTSWGTFTPTYNASGKVAGYVWEGGMDLSGYANHWASHHLCDGSTVVDGCAEAIPVTFTMTAYVDVTKNACRTYTNDAGQQVCASDTRTVSLAAVRDPDVTDVCETDCGIGQCLLQYDPGCNTLADPTQRAACMQSYTCLCKSYLPDSCGPHPECEG